MSTVHARRFTHTTGRWPNTTVNHRHERSTRRSSAYRSGIVRTGLPFWPRRGRGPLFLRLRRRRRCRDRSRPRRSDDRARRYHSPRVLIAARSTSLFLLLLLLRRLLPPRLRASSSSSSPLSSSSPTSSTFVREATSSTTSSTTTATAGGRGPSSSRPRDVTSSLSRRVAGAPPYACGAARLVRACVRARLRLSVRLADWLARRDATRSAYRRRRILRGPHVAHRLFGMADRTGTHGCRIARCKRCKNGRVDLPLARPCPRFAPVLYLTDRLTDSRLPCTSVVPLAP